MANVTNSALSGKKKTRVERILEPFGARHAAHLIGFFNKIADSDFDVVMFIARKSLCIYRMMELCGIKKITIPVISDALLDSDPKQFVNKRILVIDDTLFVGTTLSDAKERLDSFKPAILEFWVYCADKDNWSEENFRPDYIHVIMSAQEAIEFCAAECRAMINAGVPYLSDFSASKRIRLTPAQLDKAIKPINWVFHDVSSQYHEKSKVKYYSAFPDTYSSETVRSVIGNSIFAFIELAKIRVFATWTGRAYEVTFVPVITFSPTDRKSVARAVHSLCSALSIDQKIFGPSSVMEKMRFLQFVIGALFLRTYWDSFDRFIALSPDSKFSYEWCSSVFPEQQAEAVSRAIATIYKKNGEIAGVKQEPPKLVRNEPPEIQKETADDIERFLEDYFSGDADIDFGHTPLSDLTAIFLEFQARFETAARLEIKNKETTPKYRDRLKRGIAWRALCSYLLKKYRCYNNRHSRNILSLVLDRLIDFGIAVPIIARSGENLYRAYRHGEDVRFGAQEESLVFNLLQGFQNARGNEGIEATYIEKLIVILLRVGMDEEWLNLWYSNSGRDTLVRVGYHLQGAVPISPRREDELVPDGESSWLSRRLLKTGTLTLARNTNRPGMLYHLGQAPEAAHLRTDAPRTAKALGNAIGKACVVDGQQRTEVRPISSEDLIILTSCANAFDTTGAVAAELRIFSNWYEREGARIIRADFANPRSYQLRSRVKGSSGAQAVNSATWKLRKFESGAINDIKTKIAALKNYDPDWDIREGYWNAIFNSFNRTSESSEERKLARIRKSAADIIACFEFVIECLEAIVALSQRPSDKGLEELASLIRSAKLPAVVPGPNLGAMAGTLTQHDKSNTALRRKLSEVARALDGYGRSLCAIAAEEAVAAERLILKVNLRLSRVQYAYMIWYDILDVRVRRQGTPSATENYSQALNKFRADVNSMLKNAQERIRAARGDLFSDTGDLGSFNDGKHIFLNVLGGSVDEGSRIVCDIVRIAESTGVKLRLLALPTDLRGEYAYLNRGATSIDGDFKSHVHTLVQAIEHHDEEQHLGDGECIIWLLSDMMKEFKAFGSVVLDKGNSSDALEISVDIKGFVVRNRLSYIKNVNS